MYYIGECSGCALSQNLFGPPGSSLPRVVPGIQPGAAFGCDMGRSDVKFWDYVDIKNPHDCWLWKHIRNKKGYGIFCCGGKRTIAHRYVLIRLFGMPENSNMYALHTCDVPNCVNPEHLYWGTPKQNTQDMMRKKRYYKGVLTEGQVREIRASPTKAGGYMANGMPKYFADKFHVSPTNISKVFHRDIRRDVP